MRLLATILVGSLFSTQVQAQCEKPVTPLQKGEQAPCEGFLFSPEKELQLRKQNEEYKLLMEQTKLHIQQIELYKLQLETTATLIEKEQQKAELWRKAAEESTLKLVSSNEHKQSRDLLFILAGVGLTVAAGYAVGQVSK